MIKLLNLNKYFNKGKANQIHVINNTTLEFPEKGLVALTGPSGCGKTTLLNVIGGLDKFASGEIAFDEHVMSKYRPLEWDIIRNKYVGYIFQNYNLVEDKTVYENIELALNMAGLYDKDEIEKRINYVLESVGMYNYRRRNVQALSGGQQQRVAIARAIAKNPKVVLADEPTGNLDANNTFEVMSIIKKISQECLVILVSHERSLVDFYADRVITLLDGVITSDIDNLGNKSFEHKDERIIYLKDLHKDESLSGSGIERYYEASKDDSLSFQIVEVKDSVYIRAKSQKKIKYLTDDTEIRLVNEHYKAKQSEDALEYSFDLHQFGTIQQTSTKRSYIKLGRSIRNGFIKMLSPRKVIGKLFLFAYFVISALIAYQIATFGNLTRNSEENYLKVSQNLVSVQTDDFFTSTDIDYILDNVDNIEWSPYYNAVTINYDFADFYQGDINAGAYAYPIKVSQISDDDLMLGRLPENTLEIVIDRWILDLLLEGKKFTDLNITDITGFIGHTVYASNAYYYDYGYGDYYNEQQNIGFEIVGIIDTGAPTIAVKDSAILAFTEFGGEYLPYGALEERIVIEDGRDVENDDEILIGSQMVGFELDDTFSYEGKDYTIVGIFSADEDYLSTNVEYYFTLPDADVEQIIKYQVQYYVSAYNYWSDSSGLYFYSDDLDQAIEDIIALDHGYTASNAYESQKETYLTALYQENAAQLRTVIIVLAGIIVYIYFMMRSSMLSRIREIGIYRSIGATKRDIYKIFVGEIIATTTIGALTGYLAMSFLIYRVQVMTEGTLSFFYLPFTYFIGGIIFIYVLNLMFGMLPVFNLLRKTPSEINVKYDI